MTSPAKVHGTLALAALHSIGQRETARKLGPPSLRSGCHYLFRRFHDGQGDDDAKQCQPTGDIKGIDIAAEHVLGLTGYKPSRDRADSIG